MDGGAWWATVHGVATSWTRLSDFTFMHWRRKWQPTDREPGGLPSMGSHRVGHDWSDLANINGQNSSKYINPITSHSSLLSSNLKPSDHLFSSVAQSCPTLPCPSPTPRVHSNSRPSSRWCHLAISSSVVPFSSCPQSLPTSVFSNESTLSWIIKTDF